MAASAIDEALRNCVAVGADPSRIAILDNFCWGYTDRPETLGSLVRAALACKDVAISMGTPFISGKDSLNNEFSFFDDSGEKQTISIPPTLLISAMGQVPDAAKCVTMDLKSAGNAIYLVGRTSEELGGSHWSLVRGLSGGQVPRMDTSVAKPTFEAMYKAITSNVVRACHDLSEGGLAVAAAEMAFSGGLGIALDLSAVRLSGDVTADGECTVKLFSESNTRFLVEVPEDKASEFEACFEGLTVSRIGSVTNDGVCKVVDGETTLIESEITALKEAWQKPLRW